ncbi:MAG: phage portal protein, partial [Chloroflexia bacterium]|nr:phage portal protein [Chloroflexia bacterium]
MAGGAKSLGNGGPQQRSRALPFMFLPTQGASLMLLNRLFPRERRSGTYSPSQWFIDWIGGGAKTLSGMQVNASSATTISAVWRGINLVAGDVAKVPVYLYRRQGTGKVIADKHPVYSLVRRKPNPWTKAFEFKRLLTANAILSGNGYAWIDRSRGRAILRQLDPSATWAHDMVGDSILYLTVMEGEHYPIFSEDMLHIRNHSRDGISGVGVVQKAKESLGLTMAAERYGAAFFGNSARPNVVLTYPATMTKEKSDELREAWERGYGGVTRSSKPAVLHGGLDIKEF